MSHSGFVGFFFSKLCMSHSSFGILIFFSTSAHDQNKKINLIKYLAFPIPDSDSSYFSSLALF